MKTVNKVGVRVTRAKLIRNLIKRMGRRERGLCRLKHAKCGSVVSTRPASVNSKEAGSRERRASAGVCGKVDQFYRNEKT